MHIAHAAADFEEFIVHKEVYPDATLASSKGYYSFKSRRASPYQSGSQDSQEWIRGNEQAKRESFS